MAARRRIVYGGSLAGAIAVVALALVLLLPSGTPGAPSVSAAAALAARGPIKAAPVPDPLQPGGAARPERRRRVLPQLGARAWTGTPSATRSDQLDGRTAVTVYYHVAGRADRLHDRRPRRPLAQPPAQATTWRNGTELRTLTVNGRLVVTWRRAGDTCVLSGTGVTAAELQTLAAWKVPAESR